MEAWFDYCPVCSTPGVNLIHRNAQKSLDRADTEETRSQEGGVRIPMMGECCHCVFYVCIGQHKGSMIITILPTDKKVF